MAAAINRAELRRSPEGALGVENTLGLRIRAVRHDGGVCAVVVVDPVCKRVGNGLETQQNVGRRAIVRHERIGGAVRLQIRNGSDRGVAREGDHSGNGRDGGNDIRRFAGELLRHKSAIGHTHRVHAGAIDAHVRAGYRLDHISEEQHVIPRAGVAAITAIPVAKQPLRMHDDEAFLFPVSLLISNRGRNMQEVLYCFTIG